MIKQFLKHKCNSKITLVIAVICVLVLVISVSGCSNDNLENNNENNIEATPDIVATYRENSGEFDWTGNEYTSLLPKPKEWHVGSYLIDDNNKWASADIDNADLESTKQYIKSLEKMGITTVKYDLYNGTEKPTLNYLGKTDDYSVSISHIGNGTNILVNKIKK